MISVQENWDQQWLQMYNRASIEPMINRTSDYEVTPIIKLNMKYKTIANSSIQNYNFLNI
jgi:hypothetical protein